MPKRDERIQPNDPRRIEFRSVGDGLRRRAAADDVPGFEGYASVPWVVDSYGTAFAPGAFRKTLSERRDKLSHLWQHDPYAPIGFHRDIAEDDRGLRVDVALIDEGSAGSVAIRLLRGGVPLGLSHGFRTIRERPATDADPLILSDGMPEWIRANLPDSVWVIEEVKLYETSTVTFPANENAAIDSGSIRSLREAMRDASALTHLLDDLRAGRRLDDTVTALITDIAAAWTARPDSRERSAPAAPPSTKAPLIDDDDRRAALALLADMSGIDPAWLAPSLGVAKVA